MANRVQNQNLIKKIKNWAKSNSQYWQLIANTALIVLTIITVTLSSYFSREALKTTHIQLAQADSNINLSKKQFLFAIDQRKADSIKYVRNDSISRIKEYKDSLIAENRFVTQEKRNKLQDSINRKQLNAIQLQAKIAELQFRSQSIANEELKYQTRPIFLLTSTAYDSVKKVASFVIKNVGKRSVSVRGTIMCGINKKHLALYRNLDEESKSDLNDITYNSIKLPMPKWEFEQDSTMYYVYFKYIDSFDGEIKSFKKFFTPVKENNVTGWGDLTKSNEKIVRDFCKLRKFRLEY
jgi:hypothetical protein